eukprot:1084932-Pelagomonas_calceolata.AAC.2
MQAFAHVHKCSDLHPFHGREGGIGKSCTTGHEFVGTVVALGDNVIAPSVVCSTITNERKEQKEHKCIASSDEGVKQWGIYISSQSLRMEFDLMKKKEVWLINRHLLTHVQPRAGESATKVFKGFQEGLRAESTHKCPKNEAS